MGRPKKKWEDLDARTQYRLFYQKDKRVPADFKPSRVGRPPGIPQSPETRRRISLTLMRSDERIARRTAEAVRWLLMVYGSPKEVAKAILAQSAT